MSGLVESSNSNSSIPWSAEKDRVLARSGSTASKENGVDWIGRRSIEIEKRVSPEQGLGFGTASTRALVERSITLGFEGRLHNSASWSSHIFHLYMGMIPHDRQVDPILHYWGVEGQMAVEQFDLIKEGLEINDTLSKEEETYLKTLKVMIAHSKGVSQKDITDQQVIAEGGRVIEHLKEKKVSYLREDFIPSILKILERNLTVRHPDTTSLGAVEMMMSDAGIARWKEAIDNKQEFKSFKKFEHLRPYMTPEQLSRLDRIIEARAKALQT